MVTTFRSDRMHSELTTTLGAILDSHGPLYVVLPGSIGIVLSLILLSFSHGVFLISTHVSPLSHYFSREPPRKKQILTANKNIIRYSCHSVSSAEYQLAHFSPLPWRLLAIGLMFDVAGQPEWPAQQGALGVAYFP